MCLGLFFLVGIQLIFIGLLGEYSPRFTRRSAAAPTVIERERINVPD
jgi:hypothetical protein